MSDSENMPNIIDMANMLTDAMAMLYEASKYIRRYAESRDAVFDDGGAARERAEDLADRLEATARLFGASEGY